MTKPKYVIVVGIDYSAASERALDEAFALGSAKYGVQLHVVNVRSEPLEAAASTDESRPLPPWRYWASELQEYVARKVAAFQVTAQATPFEHLHTHQRMNDPAQELAQLATTVDADLIVVGAHDWYGAARPTPGSVAETVTRLAPCPVLVVRRKGSTLVEPGSSHPTAQAQPSV
ncbi:MAG TPA: universal stress protein [Polyangiaceae bacterium]